MTEEKRSPEYDLAERKVDAIIGFKIHIIAYLAVNTLLLVINLACFSRTAKVPSGEVVNLPFIAYFWVMWPIWGWGLGVLIHYIVVRGFCGPLAHSCNVPKVEDFLKQAEKPQP
jgi:hypothetical protein